MISLSLILCSIFCIFNASNISTRGELSNDIIYNKQQIKCANEIFNNGIYTSNVNNKEVYRYFSADWTYQYTGLTSDYTRGYLGGVNLVESSYFYRNQSVVPFAPMDTMSNVQASISTASNNYPDNFFVVMYANWGYNGNVSNYGMVARFLFSNNTPIENIEFSITSNYLNDYTLGVGNFVPTHKETWDFRTIAMGDWVLLSNYLSVATASNTNVPYRRNSRFSEFFMLFDGSENSNEYITININLLGKFDLDYQNGYDTGYDSGYSAGSAQGYQNGYYDGFEDADNMDSTALTIFTGILEVGMLPVNVFLTILNFEVFGINISGFVSALLTVSVVIIIIRFLLGGKTKDD